MLARLHKLPCLVIHTFLCSPQFMGGCMLVLLFTGVHGADGEQGFSNDDQLRVAVSKWLTGDKAEVLRVHGHISDWDVSRAQDMSYLFSGCTSVIEDISRWNTSAVTNMEGMFSEAAAFNQPIGPWDTSAVTNMKQMFAGAGAFNQPIGAWNTSAVTDMNMMFALAGAFDQLLPWNLSSLAVGQNMFTGSKIDGCTALQIWKDLSINAAWASSNTDVFSLSQRGCPRCSTTVPCPQGSACYDEVCRPMWQGFIYILGDNGVLSLRSASPDLQCQEESCEGLAFQPSIGWSQLRDVAKLYNYSGDVLLKPTCAAFSCPGGTKLKQGAVKDFEFSLSCCSCISPTEYLLPDGTCSICRAGEAVKPDGWGCEICPQGSFSHDAASTCTDCAAGTYSEKPGSSTCHLCPSGYASWPGQDACYSCGILGTSEKGSATCIFDLLQFVEIVALAVCTFGILHAAAASMKLRLPIADVSAQRWIFHDNNEGKSYEIEATLLTTCGHHGLHNYKASSFPIHVSGTANPGLDGKCFLAHVEDDKHLRMLDDSGHDLKGSCDTSAGELTISFWTAIFHRGWPLPNYVLISVLAFAAGSLVMLIENFGLCSIVGLVSASFVEITEFIKRWHRFRLKHHPLRMSLFRFQQLLPAAPTPCPKGASRGIGLSALLQLKDSFNSFLHNRSAYYVVGNIIKPLAKPKKVSYAELVGPRAAEWFVSHYWGTPFRDFCDSLAKHASGESGDHDSAYWVCFCANNQFDIAHEIGDKVHESSFFLALQGGVKGTCLVLDARALPLTRSWCIFEMLQTFRLESTTPAFSGLFFCTASGVLNRGEGSAELVSNLGERIALLDMEKSQASDPGDDHMIKEEVISSLGSFSNMNSIIRSKTIDIVLQAGRQQSQNLDRIHNLLQPVADDRSCDMV
mmetsp:Transcript_58109/g.103211  ORF Transcript_58109/g.103211 Transcript_58109/m.103211 type:complete len:910 (+) Transcript_58109:38-2767(+)